MWSMIRKLLSIFTPKLASSVLNPLKEAYEAKLKADTDEKKLEADVQINWLHAQQSILLAEQGRWLTAWIRPALAAPVVILVWKLLVWDTVLQLGVTPDPGTLVIWITVTIVTSYFLTRPFEKGNRFVMQKLGLAPTK